MSNFWQRTLTGALFVIVLIGSALLSQWSFFAIWFLVNMLCLLEFFNLTLPTGSNLEKYAGLAAGAIINIVFVFLIRGDLSSSWFYHLIPVLGALFVMKLFENTGNEIETLAWQMTSIIYICIPFSMFESLGHFNSLTYSYTLPLGFLFLQWSSDTFAYLVGKRFGKHKLFERISPKKTVEGTIGAMFLTTGIAYVISLFWDDISCVDWIVVGLIVVVFGSFGDLFESLLKRNIGIKDSGSILPGHGGVLDRFDGMFFSAPAVYFYLTFST